MTYTVHYEYEKHYNPILSLWDVLTNFHHYSPRSPTKELGFHSPFWEGERREEE